MFLVEDCSYSLDYKKIDKIYVIAPRFKSIINGKF